MNAPLPPWKMYPSHPPGSSFWRQGGIEDYILDVWRPYLKTLSEAEKENLFNESDLAQEWKEYYAFLAWVDSVDDEPFSSINPEPKPEPQLSRWQKFLKAIKKLF